MTCGNCGLVGTGQGILLHYKSCNKRHPTFPVFPFLLQCASCKTEWVTPEYFDSHSKEQHKVATPSITCQFCKITIPALTYRQHYITHMTGLGPSPNGLPQPRQDPQRSSISPVVTPTITQSNPVSSAVPPGPPAPVALVDCPYCHVSDMCFCALWDHVKLLHPSKPPRTFQNNTCFTREKREHCAARKRNCSDMCAYEFPAPKRVRLGDSITVVMNVPNVHQ